MKLSSAEILRYNRQLIMPEIGNDGQVKLKHSSVLVVGVGGLGSSAALYLAAAGIGKIGLVDYDAVDVTNLQRQIIYSTNDIGKKKLESARKAITALNPHVEVETYIERLTSENAFSILVTYDVIVDCTDNFPARYLINDACVLLNKPTVYGSVYRFEGQVSVFYSPEGPCYRCLYPSPPSAEQAPNCADGGVIGVLPGIIGSLQALEAIKLITGVGNTLIGRLILFDGLRTQFHEIKIKKNLRCVVCGEHPVIQSLIEYEEFCKNHSVSIVGISAGELKAQLQSNATFLLDVRSEQEYNEFNLGGCLIPLESLPYRMHQLDPKRTIVVCCKSGTRSAIAASLLIENGFDNVKNLIGGFDSWLSEIKTD